MSEEHSNEKYEFAYKFSYRQMREKRRRSPTFGDSHRRFCLLGRKAHVEEHLAGCSDAGDDAFAVVPASAALAVIS